MAFRPSNRHHKVSGDIDLNLKPVMSLLVVLVPMLLQTAVFQELGSVQLNLPSADEPGAYIDQPPPDAAGSMTLAVTAEGFQFISGEETFRRIGKSLGGYDFRSLSSALVDAKKRFPSQKAIVLLVGDQVLYQDIIRTMDTCRPFFPGVSLADRVQ